jgi:hypothetical protein
MDKSMQRIIQYTIIIPLSLTLLGFGASLISPFFSSDPPDEDVLDSCLLDIEIELLLQHLAKYLWADDMVAMVKFGAVASLDRSVKWITQPC